MSQAEQKRQHLTVGEIESALRALSRAEILRLTKIAFRLADGTSQTGDDLLQETLLKTLEGERKCPRDLNVSTFLINAMRSLAWAARERERSDPLAGAEDIADPQGEAPAIATADNSPEERLVAKRDYKARQKVLLDLFSEDEEALKVLLGLFDTSSPKEICETWGMNETAFATIRRRIRRTIDKAFPEGWKE